MTADRPPSPAGSPTSAGKCARELPSGHHTPRFHFNEAVLAPGIGLFLLLAMRLGARPR